MNSGGSLLVFGRSGQVARELERLTASARRSVKFLGRAELDLVMTNPGPVIKEERPIAVINASAYTAVDRAETEAAAAQRLNADVVGGMARACAALDIPFVHISTDYVFDGAKMGPYLETDPTGPLGVYGRSKLEGETLVAEAGGRWTILRTAWVFSPFGANFIKTMLRLAAERDEVSVVDDQHGRPTLAADIAQMCLRAALHEDLQGLHHLAGEDDASWADIADAVFERFEASRGRRPSLNRIPTSAYPTPAKRPANSRLDTRKLRAAAKWSPRPWRESVDSVLGELL